MTPQGIFDAVKASFGRRKFASGLLVAFIDFYRKLGVPGLRLASLEDVLNRYPQRDVTAAGHRANTLIVEFQDSTVSLRPFYNGIEQYFRAEHKRFDYPSCAPHATQAWADYRTWLDALAGFTDEELGWLREQTCKFVLDSLPSQEFDPKSARRERPILLEIIDDFDLRVPPASGEPTGAAFQGLVFGFLRADNPHLQLEIDKVRTGSRRLQRVGDIDGWDGERLAISAEVKHRSLKASSVPQFAGFANEVLKRGSIGLVCAIEFVDGARSAVSDLGLTPLSYDDMRIVVQLWDPAKQRIAVSSFAYYARHVEKNSSLSDRLGAFIESERSE